tara:strand:+ start:188 stop:364 length:177 start_codon:yes stop_codon:yes gene_type:complete
MQELKLVGILLKSLLLWICLFIPRVIAWILGTLEAFFRILKETINKFIEVLKSEVLKK